MSPSVQYEFVASRDGQFLCRVPLAPGASVVGRGADCDVVVPAESVSPRHVRIRVQGREVYIEDLGSTSGTYLNGQRVLSQTLWVPEDSLTLADVDVQLVQHLTKTTASSRIPSAHLVMQPSRGSLFGHEHETRSPTLFHVVSSPVAIGRTSGDGVDIRIEDTSVSRRHARLVCDPEEGGWWIEDLGSSGGTFVNGVRVNRCLLKGGETIRLGSVDFKFTGSRSPVARRSRTMVAGMGLSILLLVLLLIFSLIKAFDI